MSAKTVVLGEPEIVGGLFDTVILNAGKLSESVPSDTLITTPLWVPLSEADGVPAKAPVVVLKLAQLGLLATENVRGSPSGSLAVGLNV